MTPRRRALCAAVLAWPLISCTDAGSERDALPPSTFAFDCSDGSYVVARFEGQERLWLFLPGRTLDLPRARSGSGARYSDGATTFWIKGHEATLETAAGTDPITCSENRRASIIEDAKLRGNDFWATGNEPGWTLEIGPDSSVLVTGYGSQRHVFSTPEPTDDIAARRTVWAGEAGDGPVTVEVLGEECFDDMSGERFAVQVVVTIGEQRLRGCGQSLH